MTTFAADENQRLPLRAAELALDMSDRLSYLLKGKDQTQRDQIISEFYARPYNSRLSMTINSYLGLHVVNLGVVPRNRIEHHILHLR